MIQRSKLPFRFLMHREMKNRFLILMEKRRFAIGFCYSRKKYVFIYVKFQFYNFTSFLRHLLCFMVVGHAMKPIFLFFFLTRTTDRPTIPPINTPLYTLYSHGCIFEWASPESVGFEGKKRILRCSLE